MTASATIGASADGRWRPRTVAAWWFTPVIRAAPWRAVFSLFTGVLAAPVWLVLGSAAVVLTIGLTATVIGLPLLPVFLAWLAKATELERLRAGLGGPPIAVRPLAMGSVGDRLTDPARWHPLAGAMAGVFVWTGLFAVVVTSWSLVAISLTLPLWGNAAGMSWLQIAGPIVLGVLGIGFAPRLSVAAGRLGHRFAAWAYGPDPTASLRARVDSLAASRQEILDAVADERRRIERNLHDGVQQGLVAMGIDMSLAVRLIDEDPDAARDLIVQAQDKARASIGELRQLGRGLHPAILGDRGLDAALSSVVAGSSVPTTLTYEVAAELHPDIAAAAYFVVSEAIGNVMKHANAGAASVSIAEAGDEISIAVDDDGKGGADPSQGTGLSGLFARVGAVDGRLDVDSAPGGPTSIRATLPLRAIER